MEASQKLEKALGLLEEIRQAGEAMARAMRHLETCADIEEDLGILVATCQHVEILIHANTYSLREFGQRWEVSLLEQARA